ncbi:hypothetical protein H5T55_01835 [Candidatus Bipolaricaulota bacterium]|nr:hypothetical protein [Candidatus Bipolaricaulota bacterium]
MTNGDGARADHGGSVPPRHAVHKLGLLVAVLTFAGAGLALDGEVGTRFEVGDRMSGGGWFSLSGEAGAVSFTGRVEGDLLCGCFRRGQFGAATEWGGFSAGVEAGLLATGRVDLSTAGSWKALDPTDLGIVSVQVGGKVTAIDAFGGRFLTAAGWVFGRLDRDPVWVEVNANLAWPGGSPHGELRMGISGSSWSTLSIFGSGMGLELGAETPYFSVQTHLSLFPALQTVVVGSAGEGVRVQGRLTVRAGGEPSGSLSLAATQGPWQGSVLLFLAASGLERVTVEVRYALGE